MSTTNKALCFLFLPLTRKSPIVFPGIIPVWKSETLRAVNSFNRNPRAQRIDIITKISGDIAFAKAYSQAEIVDFDDVRMPILSLDDLLTNKLATGRPKDLEDVRLLKKHHS